MKVLGLLAAAAIASAVPINADIKAIQIDSNGVARVVKEFHSVDLDQFTSFEQLVESLKLNELDDEVTKQEKLSTLETLKSFENPSDALAYFKNVMLESAGKVEEYVHSLTDKKAPIEEEQVDQPISEETDLTQLKTKPHFVKPHFYSEEDVKKFLETKHHGFKAHHGYKPHGVKTHHGEAFYKEHDGFNFHHFQHEEKPKHASFINYVKSFFQTSETTLTTTSDKDVDFEAPVPEKCAGAAGFLGVAFFGVMFAVIKRAAVRRRAEKEDEEESLPEYEEVLNEKN